MWSVYMIRCADGSLYTGVAIDVEKRFEEHQGQGPKSAKYTRGRGPLELVFYKEIGTRSEACAEEYRIKQLSKAEKEALID
ncbi:MAG: GIY-YIG nuclease family protein [Opitutaceae bacterium]